MFAYQTSGAEQTGLELKASVWLDSAIEDVAGAEPRSFDRNEYLIGYTWLPTKDSSERLIEVSYAHQPVLIRAGDPAHNGYFHRLDIRYTNTFAKTTIDFSTGIHASSNMFKHGEFHDEALVSRGAISHQINPSLAAGMNGDYRFGHFLLYPTISLQAQGFAGDITLNIPTGIHWLNNNWTVSLERYGEKWAALSKARDVESAFYLNEWRFKVSWAVPVLNNDGLEFGAGYSFDTEIEYADLLLGDVRRELESALYIWLRVRLQ